MPLRTGTLRDLLLATDDLAARLPLRHRPRPASTPTTSDEEDDRDDDGDLESTSVATTPPAPMVQIKSNYIHPASVTRLSTRTSSPLSRTPETSPTIRRRADVLVQHECRRCRTRRSMSPQRPPRLDTGTAVPGLNRLVRQRNHFRRHRRLGPDWPMGPNPFHYLQHRPTTTTTTATDDGDVSPIGGVSSGGGGGDEISPPTQKDSTTLKYLYVVNSRQHVSRIPMNSTTRASIDMRMEEGETHISMGRPGSIRPLVTISCLVDYRMAIAIDGLNQRTSVVALIQVDEDWMVVTYLDIIKSDVSVVVRKVQRPTTTAPEPPTTETRATTTTTTTTNMVPGTIDPKLLNLA